MAKKKNQWIKALAAVALSTAISLILAEVLARQIVPVDRGHSDQYRIPDRTLGWVLEPNRKYSRPLVEGTVVVEYNSRGWRDVEHSEEKPDGTFRILILGDSFMEAYTVALEESFGRRLEATLVERGLQAEVISLGVGGYGTLQEYLAFREEGLRYDPDLVLLGFTVSNDVMNNSYELSKLVANYPDGVDSRPFLVEDSEDFAIVTVNYDAARARFEEALRWRQSIASRIREHSVLLQLAYQHLANLTNANRSQNRYQSPEYRSEPSRTGVDVLDQDSAYLGVHYCEEPDGYTKSWDVTRRILGRLKREIEESGAELVVFSVPAIHETVRDYILSTTNNAADPSLVCLEDAPGYARLASILGELDIEYVDLLPAFRNASLNGEPRLFLRSDVHWGAAGHQVATQVVLEKVFAASRFPE